MALQPFVRLVLQFSQWEKWYEHRQAASTGHRQFVVKGHVNIHIMLWFRVRNHVHGSSCWHCEASWLCELYTQTKDIVLNHVGTSHRPRILHSLGHMSKHWQVEILREPLEGSNPNQQHNGMSQILQMRANSHYTAQNWPVKHTHMAP